MNHTLRKKHSEDTKRRHSESTKRFWESPEGLLKKQRMSKRTTDRLKGKTYTQIYGDKAEEIKRKIGDAQRGISKSEEHNRKNSEAHLGKKRKPFSEEWRKNISKSRSGQRSNFWQGGKSFELYGCDWTDDLRESIRKRDNYICQMDGCGLHQDELSEYYKKLDVHHIDYDKHNLNPNNLITLCRRCHLKTNHNRDYWIEYFKNC